MLLTSIRATRCLAASRGPLAAIGLAPRELVPRGNTVPSPTQHLRHEKGRGGWTGLGWGWAGLRLSWGWAGPGLGPGVAREPLAGGPRPRGTVGPLDVPAGRRRGLTPSARSGAAAPDPVCIRVRAGFGLDSDAARAWVIAVCAARPVPEVRTRNPVGRVTAGEGRPEPQEEPAER